MSRIATLTLNPAVDKSCSVAQVVAERKLRCRQPRFDPGGGGINVARAITELGGKAVAYWTCGGAIGELLKQLLDEECIEHYPVAIHAMTRENLIVFEESSEQQFRFGMPGATLSEDEIESCLELLRAGDGPPEYLVLSGSLPPGVDDDLYARFATAMDPSCRIILDTSGKPLQVGVKARTYLIKPNVQELGQLAGRPIEDDVQIREVAETLIGEDKARVVVTSLGSGGAVLTTADEHHLIRAPTVKIRSKVGAGDSTVAGIVLALSQGRPIADAVRFGVAAGSAAVMTDGTKLCHRSDTERLFEEMTKSTAGPARRRRGRDLRPAGADDESEDDPRQVQAAGRRSREEDMQPAPLSALQYLDRIARRLKGKDLALFLDYDGTLTPIVRRPKDAMLTPARRSLLAELAAQFTVAIVSGRDRRDAEEMVQVQELVYAGSHGFDIRGPGGLEMQLEDAQRALPELDDAESDLHGLIGPIEGARVERKKFAIAVHYREVRSERDIRRIERAVDETNSKYPGLRKRGGKKIFELQPDVPWDKGHAVLWLTEALGLAKGKFAVIYLGDDVTDEDAFRALRSHRVGIGIRVGEHDAETEAPYILRNCDEVEDFLRGLKKTLEKK